MLTPSAIPMGMNTSCMASKSPPQLMDVPSGNCSFSICGLIIFRIDAATAVGVLSIMMVSVGTPLRLTIVPSVHEGVKLAIERSGMAEKLMGEVIYWSSRVFMVCRDD